jgi:hypothetical protein
MTDERLQELVEHLATTAGIAGVKAPQRLPGGRNSRAYRIETDRRPLFLKVYPPRELDPRPRLRCEWAFLRFAWSAGIRAIPEPVAADENLGLGLYAFVEGRALQADEIDSDHIDQALDFIDAINRLRATPEAAELPPASEACFSFSEHLRRVDQRTAALAAIAGAETIDRQAADFVADRLAPAWAVVKQRALQDAKAAGFAGEPPLPVPQRCLSPSDFGFHNALVRLSGEVVFHDFEYAGWDDPAKLVADFFHQPELPVPSRYRETCQRRIIACLGLPAPHAARMAALEQILGVKWVCIALNDFLAAGESRRRFTAPEGDATERKRTQLRQARRLLERLEDESRSDSPSPLPSQGRGPGG